MQLPANKVTKVFTALTSGKFGVKNVRFCNTGTRDGSIRLWKGTTVPTDAAPITGDEWVYGKILPAGTEAETTGMYLAAGESIYAWVSIADISVNVHGPEGTV